MTNIKQICAQLIELWDADCDINMEINELRAALAEPEPQRCYLYNPVQIAECGGPCQQGPEHCDCGELCVTEPASEPPTDGEVVELVAWLLEGGEDAAANGWDHQARQFARAAELLQLQHPQPDFAPCLPATDFRALCAELLSALENEGYAHWVVIPDEDELCLRARAVLNRYGNPTP